MQNSKKVFTALENRYLFTPLVTNDKGCNLILIHAFGDNTKRIRVYILAI